jgi:ribosomal protection tetracycline resistance protein
MYRSHSTGKNRDGFRTPGEPPGSPRWLNLGVLAHVDAGKTSLTEALLHAGGALDHVGRVDDGTTQTDTLALERRRGITIRTAVASFTVGDVTVNLVDTPGHPDFIAEVDRSLAVLDGAILVVSAVEGVQAQTIVLYRALRRLGVPVVFFVNKIDRLGADPDRVLVAIDRRLTSGAIPLGSVRSAGTGDADYLPYSLDDAAIAEALTADLADHDEKLLESWVNRGKVLDPASVWPELRRLTRRELVQPLSFGSAITGAGVDDLIDIVTRLLPAKPSDGQTAMSGQVFKVERDSSGARTCLVRLRSGTLALRDQVFVAGAEIGKVTELEVYEPNGPVRRETAIAGQVARVHGLAGARLGDRLGSPTAVDVPQWHFSPPTLETTIVARDPNQQHLLHRALTELSDIDPLIRLRPDVDTGALRISVYGEVQQQVIADTLALDYGVDVEFRSTKIICVERPAGIGQAVRRIGDPDHLYGYTLGVTVSPNLPGAGVELAIAAPRLDLPLHIYSTVDAFHQALLGYLDPPLATGPHGWHLVDIRVDVTESDYNPPGPAPADVRHTLAIVVTEAIQRAGTIVCEPIERFRLETPADTIASTLNLLARHRAVPETPEIDSTLAVINGTIPTAEVDQVHRELHGVTHGEGILESHLDHYQPQQSLKGQR